MKESEKIIENSSPILENRKGGFSGKSAKNEKLVFQFRRIKKETAPMKNSAEFSGNTSPVSANRKGNFSGEPAKSENWFFNFGG